MKKLLPLLPALILTSSSLAQVAPAPKAQPPQSPRVLYVVKDGDTLASIAKRFGLAPDTVRLTNGGSTTLYIGQALALLVPATPVPTARPKPEKQYRIHQVRTGDTLWGIARRYKVSVQALKAANPNLGASPPPARIIIPPS